MEEFDRKQSYDCCCAACDRPLCGDDIVFHVDNMWLCSSCMTDCIDQNFTLYELAEALEIPYSYVADVFYAY